MRTLKPNRPNGSKAKKFLRKIRFVLYFSKHWSGACDLGTGNSKRCKRRALAIDQECAEAHGLWSLLEAKRGNLERSMLLATKAVKLDSDSPSLHYLLGNALLKAGDLVAAASYMRQAITLAAAMKWEFAGAHKQLSAIWAQRVMRRWDRRDALWKLIRTTQGFSTTSAICCNAGPRSLRPRPRIGERLQSISMMMQQHLPRSPAAYDRSGKRSEVL